MAVWRVVSDTTHVNREQRRKSIGKNVRFSGGRVAAKVIMHLYMHRQFNVHKREYILQRDVGILSI